jgi:predicted TPR repeat methyltransferase
LKAAGFETPQIENAILRKEVGKDVEGNTVIARAPR